MSAKKVLALFVYVFAISGFASNLFYIHGDAYFPSELSVQVISKIRNETAIKFPYFKAEDDIFFCESFGCENLELDKGSHPELLNNVLLIYEYLRTLIPRQEEVTYRVDDSGKETVSSKDLNAFPIVFYNDFINLSECFVGLKYNEDWLLEAQKLEVDRSKLSIGSFANSEYLTMLEWRDATQVEALNAIENRSSDKSIRIKGDSSLVAYVFSGSIDDYLNGDFTSVYAISSQGIYRVSESDFEPWNVEQFKDGNWSLAPKKVKLELRLAQGKGSKEENVKGSARNGTKLRVFLK